MPKDADKITLITNNRITNYTTGEVIEEQETKQIKKSVEPNYIKLYLTTLLAFKDLPKTLNPILLEFLNHMSYANNNDKDGGQKIYTNASMKKDIADKLGMKVNTLDKALGTFVSSGLFKRVGTGTYQVNPFMFGKGEWKDISAIRAIFDFNTGEVDANIKTYDELK